MKNFFNLFYRFLNSFSKNYIETITNFAINSATLFGIGKLKKPGTAASFLTLIVLIFLAKINIFFDLLSIIIFGILFYFAIDLYLKKYYPNDPDADPREVVLDEVLGQMIAFTPLFINNQMMIIDVIISFILFRIFDIFKPFPINFVEKKFKGAFGILADDVVAGIFAFIGKIIIVTLIIAIVPLDKLHYLNY